jgi:hypothetical protein
MDIDTKLGEMKIINENEHESSDKPHLAWLNTYNSDIYEILAKNILIPIRDIILGDISFAQKVI